MKQQTIKESKPKSTGPKVTQDFSQVVKPTHSKDIFAVVRFTNKADILDRDLSALSDACSSVIEQSLGRDDEIDVAFGPELQQRYGQWI